MINIYITILRVSFLFKLNARIYSTCFDLCTALTPHNYAAECYNLLQELLHDAAVECYQSYHVDLEMSVKAYVNDCNLLFRLYSYLSR